MGAIGFDSAFLDYSLDPPALGDSVASDVVDIEGSTVLDYTHFSLSLSWARRMARWVAWNIDGANIVPDGQITRDGVAFVKDGRVPDERQILNEAYENNRLDRGHVARRNDLLWGDLDEANQANVDSFFYTNITPQMDNFNRASLDGVWGQLENSLLKQARADKQRVSAFGGPVLDVSDPDHTLGFQIPRSFWKVLFYAVNGQPRCRAFVLTQKLVKFAAPTEDFDFEEFDTYGVTLAELGQRIDLVMPTGIDDSPFTIEAATDIGQRQPLTNVADISW